jgi:dTDP-4-amino-4,6-dideoxygalactose transaminase
MSRCVDEAVLEKLITPKTKAVITVNYAGMSDNIADIQEICQSHSVILIEDNAHGIGASYQDQPLGSFGDLAITSFHQTKNVHCGEGGALIINSDQFINAAQRIRDRGTNRKEFNEGRIDKWTWWSNGSNYYASEFQAAFLYAQLLELNNVNQHRQELFFRNLDNLKNHLPETALPYVDANCRTNGHGFSILAKSEDHRNQIIDRLHQKAIQTAFHYQPLHKAPYWHGMYKDKMLIATENTADTLLRLPMHYNLGINDVDIVCDELVKSYYQGNYNE